MATFNKLLVRGIRSFGQEDNDAGLIEFQKPLTIITGKNGCGKTTLIECLKYVSTGDLPTNGLNALIHDPVIARKAQVNSAVMLEFEDLQQHRVCASRRASASHKKASGKTTCKSEECTLVRYNKHTNEKTTISAKQADTNAELQNLIGVSKAILTNVIFCHQEHSDWPMGDNKKVKETFDQIFASDRYAKALDAIGKLRKSKDGELTLKIKDVKFLKRIKEEKIETEATREEKRASLAQKRELVTAAETKLKPMQDQLNTVMQQLRHEQQENEELNQAVSSLSFHEKRLQELQTSLAGCALLQSKEQLEQAKAQFAQSTHTLHMDQKQVEQSITDVKKKSEQLQRDYNEKSKMLGEAKHKEQQQQNRKQQRCDQLKETANQLDAFECLSQVSASMTAAEADQVLGQLETKFNERKAAFETTKNEQEEEQQRVQEQLAGIRGDIALVQANIQTKNTQLTQSNKQLAQLNQQLSTIRQLSGRMPELQAHVTRFKTELASAEAAFDETAIQMDTEHMQTELTALNTEVRKLNASLQYAGRADHIRKQKQTETEKLEKCLLKNKDSLILSKQKSVSAELKSVREQVERQHKRMSTLQAEQKAIDEQIETTQSLLSAIDANINAEIGDDDLATRKEEVERELNMSRKEKGNLDGAMHLLGKYVADLNKNACCPLCERKWTGNNGKLAHTELIAKLEHQIQSTPESVSALDESIARGQHQLNRLIKLQPDIERKQQLTDQLTAFTQRRQDTLDTLTQARQSLAQAEQSSKLLESKQRTAQELVVPAHTIDDARKELMQCDKHMLTLHADFGIEFRTELKPEHIKAELEDKQKKADEDQATLNQKKQDFEQRKARVHELRTKLVDAQTVVNEQSRGQQDEQLLVDRVQELQDTVNQLQTAIALCHNELPVHESNRAQADQTMTTLRTQHKHLMQHSTQLHTQLTHSMHLLHTTNKEIVHHTGDETQAKNIAADMGDIEEERSLAETELVKLRAQLDQTNDSIKHRAVRKRQLEDNEHLLTYQTTCAELQEKVQTLRANRAGLDLPQLEDTRRQLNKQIADLEREISRTQGQCHELNDQVSALDNKLKQGDMVSAVQAHFKALLEQKTLAALIADLNSYHKVLDDSILKYHSSKMDEINERLRHYWQTVYKDGDIDYIKIIADQDTKVTDKKRSYNYQLVMHIDGQDIEMKSRCSAGQRVLACILVRMALADVLCINCGMLALDEPTTNLDRDKVENLAEKLQDVLNQRRQQNNFQMLIITHDESFRDMLLRGGCRPDYHYRVEKDVNGHSKIKKVKTSEMY